MRLTFDLCKESSSIEKFLNLHKIYIGDIPSYCLMDSERPVHRIIYKSNNSSDKASSLDEPVGRVYIISKMSSGYIYELNVTMEIVINDFEELLK